MKPKTIRDFLLTIEDEKIRTEAIDNFDKYGFEYDPLDYVCSSVLEAIQCGFYWGATPQGLDYWKSIHAQAQNNTLKTREI